MRKKNISAIFSTLLIAGLATAECYCSFIPTYAKEAAVELSSSSSNTGSTSIDEDTLISDKDQNSQEKPANIGSTTANSQASNDKSSQKPMQKEELNTESDSASYLTTGNDVPTKELLPPAKLDPEIKYIEDESPKEKILPYKTAIYPATFRIATGYDGDVESANAYSTSNDYLDGITVSDAITDDPQCIYDFEGLECEPDEAEFTAKNKVSAALNKYPTVDDIRKVYSSFNPKTQYVVWYNINGYDSDIWVEGVIRPRLPKEEPPKEPVKEVDAYIPDVTIKIETTCDTSEFVYDGKDHYFGGFSITVTDNDPIVNSVTHFFDALGNFMTKKVNAGENGSGTFFEHNSIHYWVNIDAAYVIAKQITSYEIPFIFNGKEIAPEDIVVKVLDDSGNVISSVPTTQIVKANTDKPQLRITSRKITLEAGTTVQNYSGKTITNNNVEITSGSLLEGHKLVDVVINGSQSGVGSSVNEITSYKIVDENGNDVTQNYDVNCVNGKLILVNGNTKSNNSKTNSVSATAEDSKSTGIPQRAVVVGGKTLEKTSSNNNNQILGVNRLARMSQTFDSSNIILRFAIILVALISAIYLMKSHKKGCHL